MPIDVDNADLLLSTTRSVRKRLDFERPVEREVLLECLQLAVQAPTASNRQTWRWMVVTHPELRGKIAEYYRAAAMPYLSEALAATEGEGGQDKRIFDSASTWPRTSRRRPPSSSPASGRPGEADQTGMIVALGSIVQAGWSFQLALRARGLGSTWTTLHLSDAKEVAELLGIPAGVTQVGLIPVAYTKGTTSDPPSAPRSARSPTGTTGSRTPSRPCARVIRLYDG